ncbi:hypothetical protein QBC33DRAFT_545749 [Phialemonium atrogriseum]|uniref:Aminoglycoside phosphotransferase domain-containing protein n=1 Tax=Phialemonium atrogriseum TaxID=1093897 RepID=A0AAJ0FLH1_9PEZI|nr:uncharacterized protein QBC33DRAFT_545749 [Phialemonium atrogriseum]KAK1765105.1 hypothetical protein QBC33DRAFT_545749 [Phialemonium atrogriseum]
MQFIEASGIQDIAKKFGTQQWGDRKSKYYDLIAEGIQLLRRMPPPLPGDPTPGPCTSSRRIIKHMLFKDHEAPIEYNTVEELQDHLNRVARLGYRNNPNPPVVNLEKELVFCYTDFNDENFMFTTDADCRLCLYIVDFEHASFLPVSFLAYAFFEPNSRWFLCRWIGDRIGSTLPRVNLEVMQRISYMFQISTWRIGLSKG